MNKVIFEAYIYIGKPGILDAKQLLDSDWEEIAIPAPYFECLDSDDFYGVFHKSVDSFIDFGECDIFTPSQSFDIKKEIENKIADMEDKTLKNAYLFLVTNLERAINDDSLIKFEL